MRIVLHFLYLHLTNPFSSFSEFLGILAFREDLFASPELVPLSIFVALLGPRLFSTTQAKV